MSAEVTSEIVQPAKHGWVVDLQQGAARFHVRVFAVEEQDYQQTRMEMPVTLDKPAAITALRQAMESLRESMHGVKGGPSDV